MKKFYLNEIYCRLIRLIMYNEIAMASTSLDQALENLHRNIQQVVSLSDEECCRLTELFHLRKLEKRELWMKCGGICNEIAFVVKGAIRTYYTKNDTERTSQFFFRE